MNINLKALPVIAATIAVGTIATTKPVFAASVYSFKASPDSGSLTGQTFSGNVKFDDSVLSGSGEETVSLSDFNFSFLGNAFTLIDDPLAFAQFFNGDFLGVEYGTTDFQLLSGLDFFDPALSSINDAFFSYDVASGAGFGDVSYKLVATPPTPPAAVPTPALLPGLIGMGVAALRKRKQTVEQES